MPELHSILGSLFADIAQSVFTSDLYSRDISRYYEQDGLLRHFPVPRTEIEELDLQLKFAISGIELNPAQSTGREANAAAVFIDFSYDLSEIFFEHLYDSLKKIPSMPERTLYRAQSPVNTIYLRQDLLRFFLRNLGRLIQEEGSFDTSTAQREIEERLVKIIKEYVETTVEETKLATLNTRERKALDKLIQETQDEVFKKLNLANSLKEIAEPLRFAWTRAGDFKLDVEITADKLQELEASHLSTVQIKTRVRNYIWSKVEHEGKESWWMLQPE